MDRRDFLKIIGVASALTPLNTLGLSLNSFSAHEKLTNFLPYRIKIITIGDTSLFDAHEHFNSSIDILRTDRVAHLTGSGVLKMCSELSPPLESTLSDRDWQKCEHDMQFLDVYRLQLVESEKEIAAFINGTEWLFIYAVMDNAIAFEAAEKISRMAQMAGVKTLTFVATPYDPQLRSGLLDTATFDYPSENLRISSQLVVERLRENCNGVFHVDGVWYQEDDLSNNWFSMQCRPLNLLSEILYKCEDTENTLSMLSSSHNCVHDYTVTDTARDALSNAILPYGWVNQEGRDKHITSGGAIICITGHPHVAEKLKQEILIELNQPEIFHREGFSSFWRDKPEFEVITRHDVEAKIEHNCVVSIFSTNCIS